MPPNRIQELCKATGTKRAEIAVKCKVDPSTVWRWETGKSTIPDDKKFLLAELFGVSVTWLMGWEDAA